MSPPRAQTFVNAEAYADLVGTLREVLADGDLHPSDRLLERMAHRVLVAQAERRLVTMPPPAAPAPVLDRDDSWFQTHSNLTFFLVEPDPELVSIQDIAHALSMQCRFNGHTPNFYSVAQHSELVARCLMAWNGWHPRTHGARDEDEACRTEVRWGLLHDAAEAYVGDLIRPLKKLLPEFSRFEEPIERAIAHRFALPWPMPEMVKRADRAVLAAERKWLRPAPPRPIAGDEDVEPWPAERIVPLAPARAEAGFTDLYRQLYGIGEVG